MPNGYWNAHSDRDWGDQLHEPPDDEDGPDHDPQPRWILDDPWFADALRGEIRDLTRILYPEARIPETPMNRFRIIEAESESDPNSHRNAVHIGDDTDPHLFTVWARGQGNGSGRATAERGIKNPAELEMWQRAHQLCDLLNRDSL